ncbi:TPA: helix-turn-helix domain-containing protein [Citrobacter freundii]|uniref:transcriptional regulator n=1 Tax=Citrobacter farmeri TaxID=67824 RepID=UPI0018AB255B|nr:YdaS family helix-turn-helix protein [Citrobacter farmeri]HAT2283651.1 helix-turn-helix domain-containing protein [Citrobacter freundii]MDB2182819.1 YdaS family helix-turn-helix protein [Citrobacter farmeri]HAT2347644.1 helix-turn-helix domain-containing protein [Citrobacter freundii]HAT2429234.1 helix-turn-helix domain-containing protein [Citrobacter freundii]HAT2498335.1 helix-turn-helix domain-containing protein [Citrobacter freundii]
MDEKIRSRLRNAVSQVAIAKALGISPQAVNQWFSKSVIPPRNVLTICEMTDWKIVPHDVRPDLYPSPEDGVPDFLRKIRQNEA